MPIISVPPHHARLDGKPTGGVPNNATLSALLARIKPGTVHPSYFDILPVGNGFGAGPDDE